MSALTFAPWNTMPFSDYFIYGRGPAIISHQGILFIFLIALIIWKYSVDFLFTCLYSFSYGRMQVPWGQLWCLFCKLLNSNLVHGGNKIREWISILPVQAWSENLGSSTWPWLTVPGLKLSFRHNRTVILWGPLNSTFSFKFAPASLLLHVTYKKEVGEFPVWSGCSWRNRSG